MSYLIDAFENSMADLEAENAELRRENEELRELVSNWPNPIEHDLVRMHSMIEVISIMAERGQNGQ